MSLSRTRAPSPCHGGRFSDTGASSARRSPKWPAPKTTTTISTTISSRCRRRTSRIFDHQRIGGSCSPGVARIRRATSFAQQPEGIEETTRRRTVVDIAGPHRVDADREFSHSHYPADEIDVPGFDNELARRKIVQDQRNVL